VSEMRPDPDSDLAGEQSEYGDDTGFAAEATREPSEDGPGLDSSGLDSSGLDSSGLDSSGLDSSGLTAEDDEEPGNGAD
jgi:hypothetical protein